MAKSKGRKPKKTDSKTVRTNSLKPLSVKKSKKTTKVESKSIDKKAPKSLSEQLRLSDSYVSLMLGAAVVFVMAALFFVILKGNKEKTVDNSTLIVSPTLAPSSVVQKLDKQIYVVQDGESLWDISVKFYGDGYAYTKIIEANKFDDPDNVPPGTKIIIPPAK